MNAATVPCWISERLVRAALPSPAPAESPVDAIPVQPGTIWPESIDIRYFHVELQTAFEYLDIARGCPEYAQECIARALRLYVVVSGWVQSNGGDAGLEEHLQRLRWRIAVLQEGEPGAPRNGDIR